MKDTPTAPPRETNKHFAATNEAFQEWCKRAGIPPTSRQASKFRNKKGLAYKVAKETIK